jgi:hypothetical protein
MQGHSLEGTNNKNFFSEKKNKFSSLLSDYQGLLISKYQK